MSDFDSRVIELKAALTCQSARVAYARALLADCAAPEVVVHDAFLVVARRHEDFAESNSILAWCRGIVQLEIVSHLRKRRREPAVEDRILNDAMEATFEAHQSNESGPHADHLCGCLGKLYGRARDLIRLRHEENTTYKQLGAALEIGLEAVRKGLLRIIQQLHECVTILLSHPRCCPTQNT